MKYRELSKELKEISSREGEIKENNNVGMEIVIFHSKSLRTLSV